MIVAPVAARVRELLASANDQVEAGAAMLRLEPVGDAAPAAAAAGERIDLPAAIRPDHLSLSPTDP